MTVEMNSIVPIMHTFQGFYFFKKEEPKKLSDGNMCFCWSLEMIHGLLGQFCHGANEAVTAFEILLEIFITIEEV